MAVSRSSAVAASVTSMIRRRGALAAAVTALSLGAALLLQRILSSLAWVVPATQQGSGFYELQVLGNVLAGALTTIVPLVVGVFLSLWLLAPIAAELRMIHVIMRSVLATGIGMTLVFIVLAISGIVASITLTGALFGNSFPATGLNVRSIPDELAYALSSALNGFISVLPLGILAGVLLWYWLTQHPAKHPVSGMLDEV